MELSRGDIVIVNLNPKKGDEVGKVRPAVIVSNDDENKILDTVIVVPLSTDLLDNMEPYRMRIAKRDNLKYDSDLLINHVRTLSKKRVTGKISQLTEKEYEKLVDFLCKNFI